MYKVQENEDVTFTVKLSGVPAPTAEWFQSGKLVKKSAKALPTYDEKDAQLTVRKVVDKDAGDYTIRLKNSCGEVEANLKLIIMRKLTYITLIFVTAVCIYFMIIFSTS